MMRNNRLPQLRLVGSGERTAMPRTNPQTARRRDPTITGRIPKLEKQEMLIECLRRGINVEDWVAHACRLAFKRKEYPKPKED